MRVASFLFVLCGALLAGSAGWHYDKRDPHTGKRVVTVDAASFEATKDPSIFMLHNFAARIYADTGSTYRTVRSKQALFNEKLGTLTYGPQMSKVIKLRQTPRN